MKNVVYSVHFCCQVTDKTDPFYIDGEDVKQSNGLRYVNCARTKQEQNCEAFQYRGHIYYKTLREITIGECVNAGVELKLEQTYRIPINLCYAMQGLY